MTLRANSKQHCTAAIRPFNPARLSYSSNNADGPIRVAGYAHNSKLFALLRGTFCHGLFTFATPDQFVELSHNFFTCESVYVRFSHIAAFQPKFYIGSTSSFILDQEHSRFRKFLTIWHLLSVEKASLAHHTSTCTHSSSQQDLLQLC